MSRITYHVMKTFPEIIDSPKEIEGYVNDAKIKLKDDTKLKDIVLSGIIENEIIQKDLDNIIEYITTKIKNRIKREYSEYSHTLVFFYDEKSNILYVSWSYIHYPDVFSKKKGYEIAHKRMDRLIEYVDGDKETYVREFNNDGCPIKIRNSITEYLPKVKKYFKQIPENFDYENNMIVY